MKPTIPRLPSAMTRGRSGSVAGPASRIRYLLVMLLILAPPVRAAEPQVSAAAGDARRGEQLYMTVGCYECHGTRGAGALNNGPQIAPNPIAWMAFLYQMRHPIGAPRYGNMKMPQYGPKVLTDAQIADIYAYVSTIKSGPASPSIPLLRR